MSSGPARHGQRVAGITKQAGRYIVEVLEASRNPTVTSTRPPRASLGIPQEPKAERCRASAIPSTIPDDPRANVLLEFADKRGVSAATLAPSAQHRQNMRLKSSAGRCR